MFLSSNKKQEYVSAFTINVIFIVFVIIGLSLLPFIPVKLHPGKSLAMLTIDYYYPHATPEIVENDVTSKIERVLQTVKGIEAVRSSSGEGWGNIELDISKGMDKQFVKFQVLTLIRQIYPLLPEAVSYPVLQHSQGENKKKQMMRYSFNGDVDSYELYTYLRDHIRPSLQRVPEIYKIDILGSTPYHWQIVFNEKSLSELAITARDIKYAINSFFKQTDLGYLLIDDGAKNYSERVMAIVRGEEKNGALLGDIPIKKIGRKLVFLKDVADIKYVQKPPTQYQRINGLTAIDMVIYADDDANQLVVAEKVRKTINHLKESLPNIYGLDLVYDATDRIKSEAWKTILRTLFSIVILLSFILILSRNFRYLLVISISIFTNLAIAVFFYYIFQVEIHLYSLAGITVSLGIIIDNSIIMTDHVRYKNNRKVFIPILAATLTTIGALVVIFFLNQQQKINLFDFALVIIINLSISLAIALFLIPALIEKIKIDKRKRSISRKSGSRIVRFNHFYSAAIVFLNRYKVLVVFCGILGFGIPFHLLPRKVDDNKWYSGVYNATLGSDYYLRTMKVFSEKYLGGSSYFFSKYLENSDMGIEEKQVKLNVLVRLPSGGSIRKLNEVYRAFENYLSQFDGVEFYTTNINGLENSVLEIFFTDDAKTTSFPLKLKGELERLAIDYSSADFTIYGVGKAFSNAQTDGYTNSILAFSGYNYEKLSAIVRAAKAELSANPRIVKVSERTNNFWGGANTKLQYIDIHNKYLAASGSSLIGYVQNYKRYDQRGEVLMRIPSNDGFEDVNLLSDASFAVDLWKFQRISVGAERANKLLDVAEYTSEEVSKTISRENQEYTVRVGYDFIGSEKLGDKVLEAYQKKFNADVPIGYKVYIPEYGGWNYRESNQYTILFLMFVIIFFICSILLESFTKPFVVLLMIPLSFIGIFLIFPMFEVRFDQGGYASFLLVSGLVVNSALYIIYDFKNVRQTSGSSDGIKSYLKAFNLKIIPILLTILSTVLGLLPFIFWGRNESFWFALAVGTIGGLIFSIPILLIFLPLLLKDVGKAKTRTNG